MKRIILWPVLIWMLAAACTQSPREVAPAQTEMVATGSATVTTASATVTTGSATVTVTPTASRPLSDVVVTTTPRPPQPTSPPVATSDVATPDVATLRETLPQQLAATAVANDTGYALTRISGAGNGFRSRYYCDGPYRWLGNNHLLLYPIIGFTTWFEEPTGGEVTLPVVWELGGAAAAWTTAVATDRCKLPVYSAALDRLIDVRDGQVQLFALDGQPDEATYVGAMPLTLAPSGLRLLAGYHWIDLENGRSQSLQPSSTDRPFWQPRWSANERMMVQCCLMVADADSGEVWRPNTIGDIFFGGIGIGPGSRPGGGEHLLTAADGQLRGLLLEAQAAFVSGGVYNPLPLIDPTARTYTDLRPELGLADEALNCQLDVAPDDAHAWVQCWRFDDWQIQASLLVDLQTSPMQWRSLPGAEMEGWSPDGRFFIYYQHTSQTFRLYDTETETDSELIADPGDQTWVFRWSPASDLLTYWLPISSMMWLHDPIAAETWNVWLPTEVAEWSFSPSGAQIAVQGMNGRLYLLTPARQPRVQPLTPPIANIHSVGWSPAEDQIAFGDDTAVYIVSLQTASDWQTATALDATFRYPPGWQLRQTADSLIVIDLVQVGTGGYPYQYFVDVRSYPNPDGMALLDRVSVDFPTLRDSIEVETVAIGAYTTYWTDDMPSAEGSLTVFFEDGVGADGRFLAFSLNPYHPVGKYPYQDDYEALFRQLLASVQLSP